MRSASRFLRIYKDTYIIPGSAGHGNLKQFFVISPSLSRELGIVTIFYRHYVDADQT